jgi:hypothetical protein
VGGEIREPEEEEKEQEQEQRISHTCTATLLSEEGARTMALPAGVIRRQYPDG